MNELVYSLQDLPKNATTVIYGCKETGRPFRLIQQEIKFYRTMQLPPPCFAPQTRHTKRYLRRNRYEFYETHCDLTGCKVCTTFLPTAKVKILSEEAYLQEVG